MKEPKQRVEWARADANGLAVVKFGSVDQQVLAKRGDDIRIDWGHLYLAAPETQAQPHIIPGDFGRTAFCGGGEFPMFKMLMPQPASEAPVAALAFEGIKVGTAPVSRWLMLAYDDIFSIQYFKQNLRAYWRRTGWEAADLLKASAQDYAALQKRCAAFDAELMADLEKAGSEQ